MILPEIRVNTSMGKHDEPEPILNLPRIHDPLLTRIRPMKLVIHVLGRNACALRVFKRDQIRSPCPDNVLLPFAFGLKDPTD